MDPKLRRRFVSWFEKGAFVLASALALLAGVTFMAGFSPRVLALLQQTDKINVAQSSTNGPSSLGVNPQQTTDSIKAQEDRVNSAIDTLKERANAQQTLIGALTTVTSIYAVILSLAAYFRLQQLKEETKDSIEQSAKKFDRTEADLKKRFDEAKQNLSDLSREVRADIPAVHGIGQRLEELLVQLQQRLPVDGAGGTLDNYSKLTLEHREQTAVDEMVINSLDIFNIRNDIGLTRTVSRLYVSMGQFYFIKAKCHRDEEEQENAKSSLCRSTIYFNKAVAADPTDAIALRGRGVSAMWEAMWLKEDTNSINHDAQILLRAKHDILASLKQDPDEPGALDGNAWLLFQDGNYTEAIEHYGKIIALAPKLSQYQKRKYILDAYLKRASYRALQLSNIPPTDPATEREVVVLIGADCKEGFTSSQKLLADDVFRSRLREKIGLDGTLEAVYQRHSDLKETIDKIIES